MFGHLLEVSRFCEEIDFLEMKICTLSEVLESYLGSQLVAWFNSLNVQNMNESLRHVDCLLFTTPNPLSSVQLPLQEGQSQIRGFVLSSDLDMYCLTFKPVSVKMEIC